MSNNDSTEEKDGKREKKGFRLPDAYAILFFFLVLAAAATYIIPAGTFETEQSASHIQNGSGSPCRLYLSGMSSALSI